MPLSIISPLYFAEPQISGSPQRASEQSVYSNVLINGAQVHFLSQSKLCTYAVGQRDDVVAVALPASPSTVWSWAILERKNVHLVVVVAAAAALHRPSGPSSSRARPRPPPRKSLLLASFATAATGWHGTAGSRLVPHPTQYT